jgi:hypothetical protein
MIRIFTRHNPAHLTRASAFVNACNSVGRQKMPPGYQLAHTIVYGATEGEATQRCLEHVHWGDCFGFVDDDDMLTLDNTVARCIRALEATTAAVAFTHEEHVDERRGFLTRHEGPSQLIECVYNRGAIHHFALIRADALLDDDAMFAKSLPWGADWFLKAAAALRGGAVKLPFVGYEWTSHAGNYSRSPAYADAVGHHRANIVAQLAYLHRTNPESRLELNWTIDA